MISKYDPDSTPNPKDWLALDEDERRLLVEAAHSDAGLDMVQLMMHATGHVAVETQLAMEIPEVTSNFNRLRKEGLGRHDAIHACAALVMELMFNGAKGEIKGDPNEYYHKRLGEMTAEKWLNQDY